VAVLGIGNELNGDDGAGVIITEGLKIYQRDSATRKSTAARLIISAGLAPENFTGQLRQFQPNLVIFVDAAELGFAPGTVEWLSWKDTVGMSGSTHSLPLSILAQYLVVEIGCEVYLLGVQAGSNGYGEALSLPVVRAANEVIQGLGAILFPRV
jgi:hydrogenase 3 maturation protease